MSEVFLRLRCYKYMKYGNEILQNKYNEKKVYCTSICRHFEDILQIYQTEM